MKGISILAIVAMLLAYAYGYTLINDENMISKINNNPKASWKAQAHKQFEGMTMEQMKKMLGAFLPVPETMNVEKYNPVVKTAVPEEFDLRKANPACVGPIRDQASCGSCWAVSAASAMSDRFCIASKTNSYVELSPQYIVSCDKSNYGCDGGYLDLTWKFLSREGTVSEQCAPYTSGGGHVEACMRTCKNGDALDIRKMDPSTIKFFDKKNVEAMQEDIMNYGSIQMGFRVYQDFFSYRSGVYRHLSGGLAGGHAVKVIGWGVDSASNLPYWIVANSWGTTWGNNGLFWILRGSNECDCEGMMYSARPQL